MCLIIYWHKESPIFVYRRRLKRTSVLRIPSADSSVTLHKSPPFHEHIYHVIPAKCSCICVGGLAWDQNWPTMQQFLTIKSKLGVPYWFLLCNTDQSAHFGAKNRQSNYHGIGRQAPILTPRQPPHPPEHPCIIFPPTSKSLLNKDRPTWCHLFYYFTIYCSTCFEC